MQARKENKLDVNVSKLNNPDLCGNYANVLVAEVLVRPTFENPMNETKPEYYDRSNLIWAALLLLMCLDSLFWPPTKYFSAAGYLAWSLASAIKGFNWFVSRRWGPPAFKALTVMAVVLLLFSMGRRLLA